MELHELLKCRPDNHNLLLCNVTFVTIITAQRSDRLFGPNVVQYFVYLNRFSIKPPLYLHRTLGNDGQKSANGLKSVGSFFKRSCCAGSISLRSRYQILPDHAEKAFIMHLAALKMPFESCLLNDYNESMSRET